ncbi:hypothetical protein HY489_06145 [Candidatus Woesearchaeota archaeon]|nr:hypothetical protein [Candidatus Woesearchaeota archaeon]
MKHKKTWLVGILPAITLVLYIIITIGLTTTEKRIANLYQEHADFLAKSTNITPEDFKKLQQEFAKEIKLTPGEQQRLRWSIAGQKIIEKLTVNTKHCLVIQKAPCLMLTEKVIEAARYRHNTIKTITGKEPKKEVILQATPYSVKDHASKLILLLLEALAINALFLWLWPTVKVTGRK